MEVLSKVDVLISGAGAAGLTLAIELARRGVSFRIIDKLASPFPGSRGKGIQPRTLEVFQDLGIIDRILATGGRYPLERVYKDNGSFKDSDIFEGNQPSTAEPFQTPQMLPQFLTEQIMRDRLLELGGHKVEFGLELVEFASNEDGVRARIKGPQGDENIQARYLIGADGGRSFVRQTLFIDFPGKTLDMRAVVADVKLTGLGRDFWHHFNQGTMEQLNFCPLAGTDLFQIQGPVPLVGDVDLSVNGLNQMVIERTKNDRIQVQSVSWTSAYNMNARLAATYRIGSIFLVGDSAHIHPPTGGQGLNTSIQDSYNLGWKLAAVLNGASETLLQTYQEERRPIAEDVLNLSTNLLDAMKRGPIKRSRETRQLDIGYADSSIAFEKPERGNSLLSSLLKAGDRAPDAPIKMAGKAIHVFDLLKGPHWTLFGYDVQKIVPLREGLNIHHFSKVGDLADDQKLFQRFYNVKAGDWVLIRPDGYVGAIVSSDHLDELEKYLKKMGLAQ